MRAKKLTDRLLAGIVDALSSASAGGPADVFGSDGEDEERRFNMILEAHDWAVKEAARRRRAKAAKTQEYPNCARCGRAMTHGERDICHGCQSGEEAR